ncbi:hypothetical protein [Mesorhizobium sp. WSM2561]|uniref:hypothetical protein n=1 Tax=Mesorhizobium sp. WSM2561 TaxID=1040985 RepID=UPI000481BBE6|nr:hypothetical protein [Mesorhizobium sp. WSM2561]
MSISQEFFLSILAMDSYNRGYDAGIGGLSERSDGSISIGNATISIKLSDLDMEGSAEASGFYAIAYDVGSGVEGIEAGTTVISYRGTNSFGGLFASDIFSGWAVGAGILSPTTYAPGAQGQLALDFYEDITGQNPFATEGGNAILTGNSLGSGLAALVAGSC